MKSDPSDWEIHHYETVDSTNRLAASLPAWNAVRANIQTSGRGRHGRRWESSPGGLWISCVVPAPPPHPRWATLPLATGWAVMHALKELGIDGLHLRWPNDIMLGHQKLAGLLVERFHPDTAVLGIGINVSNAPETDNPELTGLTTRLADLLSPCPDVEAVTRSLLSSLSHMHRLMEKEGWQSMRDDLNASWGSHRRVACTLGERTLEGTFLGVDEDGNLLLDTGENTPLTLDASTVTLLREI